MVELRSIVTFLVCIEALIGVGTLISFTYFYKIPCQAFSPTRYVEEGYCEHVYQGSVMVKWMFIKHIIAIHQVLIPAAIWHNICGRVNIPLL